MRENCTYGLMRGKKKPRTANVARTLYRLPSSFLLYRETAFEVIQDVNASVKFFLPLAEKPTSNLVWFVCHWLRLLIFINTRIQNGSTDLLKHFELDREGSHSDLAASFLNISSGELDPSLNNSPVVTQFAKPIGGAL